MDRASDLAKPADVDTLGLPPQTVLVVVPGGLEHGGGIARQMGYFLRAHQDSKHRLRYRVIDSRGPWFLGSSPLHVIGSIAYFGRAVLTMSRACLSSPCVAHVNITGRGSTIRKVVLLMIGRTLGLRYVLHVHDYDYAEYYRNQRTFFQKLIATTFRRAEAVIVLGRRALDTVSEALQLSKDRMVILHNAVPDPTPRLDRRSVPGKPCRLLFLGYLSDRKGVANLLKALASPAVKHLRWQATLAGDGPIDRYRDVAKELGILDAVSFPGWLDQRSVSELCANADALVLPSYAEGLAMSVLEGLSHGLAVITTPVGAHSEVIEPEVSGILVPPGDIAALADALIRVIQDEGLRSRLARGARARFLEKFDVRRYAARLEQLHADLFAPQHDHPKPAERADTMTYLADQCEDSYRQPASVSSAIPRVNVLGVGVSPVNLTQTINILEKWRAEGRREYVLCTSVHGLMEAQRDPEIRRVLNRSGLTTEDGMPLVWWCQRSGYFNAGRVNGADLLFAMCERAPQNGHRHYFYGSSPPVVETMVSRLAERFPGMTIAGYQSPPFRPLTPEEDAASIRAINEVRPDYVWVGLGCPKQDKWVAQHVGKIEAAALLGVGAAFDVVAGTQPRAPLWMQRSGLEWLFRLMMEPRRLAHRYLVYNTIFVMRALQQVAGWKTYARDW